MNLPMPAEMAARLTLGRAVAADFATERRTGGSNSGGPDWYSWAVRLHTALTGLISAIDAGRHGQAPADTQRFWLAAALSDAVGCRNPDGFCTDCEASPAGLCEPHAADLGKIDGYLSVARDLGLEVDW